MKPEGTMFSAQPISLHEDMDMTQHVGLRQTKPEKCNVFGLSGIERASSKTHTHTQKKKKLEFLHGSHFITLFCKHSNMFPQMASKMMHCAETTLEYPVILSHEHWALTTLKNTKKSSKSRFLPRWLVPSIFHTGNMKSLKNHPLDHL